MGVGPEDHLREMGITVQHALPGVGRNLRDHPNVRIPVRVKKDFPLDPEAPRTQLALRYTAAGSTMQVNRIPSPSRGSPPMGEEKEDCRICMSLRSFEPAAV